MAAVLKSVQNPTISPYSHWLEDIYKLEKVDVKSIRKFEQPQVATKSNTVAKQDFNEIESDPKLNLGPKFSNWMLPYLFDEPIQLLNLSKQVEKFLLDHDVVTIKNLQESPYIKNERPALGQAFINEIQTKLKDYLQQYRNEKTDRIDFLSLLRASIGSLDRKKLYVALEPQGLHHWVTLSLSEKNELKKLNQNVKDEWQRSVKGDLVNNRYFKNALKQVFENWGYHFLLQRAGFATLDELIEYLILRAEDQDAAFALLHWIKAEFAWETIIEKDQHLFFASKEIKKEVQSLYQELLSYFPTSQFYKFDELAEIVQKEYCKSWKKLERSTIFHLVARIEDFKLSRDNRGTWLISLSPKRHFAKCKRHISHKAALA